MAMAPRGEASAGGYQDSFEQMILINHAKERSGRQEGVTDHLRPPTTIEGGIFRPSMGMV